MRVLIVEDYPPLRRSIARGLGEAGFAVDAAADGEEGLALAQTGVYDVIILDVMLPKIDGFTVLRRLRHAANPNRILVLTAKDTVSDRVHGLDLGADDYLVKPFALEELIARVKALVRRKYRQSSPVIKVADLTIDTAARVVRRGEERIDLTGREYSILEVMALRVGEVVTRDEIWSRVYDFAAETNSNVLDVYIGYIRRKLESGGGSRLIHTRRGIGYELAEEG